MQFHDRDFAYTYLSGHLHDAFSMMRIRELLADQVLDVNHMTDHQVLQQFACCLVNGTVQIVSPEEDYPFAVERNRTVQQSPTTVKEKETVDSTSTPAVEIVDESVSTEQKISEPEEWVVTVTPAMLVAAAKDGIPFCEECARAAQSNTP